jgi:ketosteroid isomerase-like protein
VSRENVEIVRGGYEQFGRRKTFVAELAAPEFAWDMSHFHGWPEQQVYEGVQGAERFLEEWTSAWDDWDLQLEELHDAGEKVLAIHRQHGRSRSTGVRADMYFAMVWTLRDGKQTRMEMYSDVEEALKAVGLEE